MSMHAFPLENVTHSEHFVLRDAIEHKSPGRVNHVLPSASSTVYPICTSTASLTTLYSYYWFT